MLCLHIKSHHSFSLTRLITKDNAFYATTIIIVIIYYYFFFCYLLLLLICIFFFSLHHHTLSSSSSFFFLLLPSFHSFIIIIFFLLLLFFHYIYIFIIISMTRPYLCLTHHDAGKTDADVELALPAHAQTLVDASCYCDYTAPLSVKTIYICCNSVAKSFLLPWKSH